MADPAVVQSIKAILKDANVQSHAPEVEAMLLDFTTGLTAQLAMRASTLRAGLGGKAITESVAQAACAIVEGESFEPPMSLEDIEAEAKAINSKALLLTSAPTLQLPPPEYRLTAAEFELQPLSAGDSSSEQAIAVRERAKPEGSGTAARTQAELDRVIADSIAKMNSAAQAPAPAQAPTASSAAAPVASSAAHAPVPAPSAPVAQPQGPTAPPAPTPPAVAVPTATSSSSSSSSAQATGGSDGTEAPRMRTVAGFPAGSVLERVPPPPPT